MTDGLALTYWCSFSWIPCFFDNLMRDMVTFPLDSPSDKHSFSCTRLGDSWTPRKPHLRFICLNLKFQGWNFRHLDGVGFGVGEIKFYTPLWPCSEFFFFSSYWHNQLTLSSVINHWEFGFEVCFLRGFYRNKKQSIFAFITSFIAICINEYPIRKTETFLSASSRRGMTQGIGLNVLEGNK